MPTQNKLEIENLGLVGDSLIQRVADHAHKLSLKEKINLEDVKFLTEAIIASYVINNKKSNKLNLKLCEILFSEKCHGVIFTNPRSCTIFALAMPFSINQYKIFDLIRNTFNYFWDNNSICSTSYPQFRVNELSYIYSKINNIEFKKIDFEQSDRTFLWLNRDNIYGITHNILYNTDFSKNTVEYSNDNLNILEMFIAYADASDDLDLFLELCLCYCSIQNSSNFMKKMYFNIASKKIIKYVDSFGNILPNIKLNDIYHQMLLYWMYAEKSKYENLNDIKMCNKHNSIGKMFVSFNDNNPVLGLSQYSDICKKYGGNDIIDRTLSVFKITMLNFRNYSQTTEI